METNETIVIVGNNEIKNTNNEDTNTNKQTSFFFQDDCSLLQDITDCVDPDTADVAREGKLSSFFRIDLLAFGLLKH